MLSSLTVCLALVGASRILATYIKEKPRGGLKVVDRGDDNYNFNHPSLDDGLKVAYWVQLRST